MNIRYMIMSSETHISDKTFQIAAEKLLEEISRKWSLQRTSDREEKQRWTRKSCRTDVQTAICLRSRRVSMNYVNNSTWRDVIVDVIHQLIGDVSGDRFAQLCRGSFFLRGTATVDWNCAVEVLYTLRTVSSPVKTVILNFPACNEQRKYMYLKIFIYCYW